MRPRCDLCPLRMHWENKGNWRIVDSEINEDTSILLIGDAPGKQETLFNRPFVGPAGVEAIGVLRDCGRVRHDVSWTNVCACRFPKDNDKEFLAILQKRNRARIKKGKEPIPTPMECCRPRLEAEIAQFPSIIPLGSMATKAVLPGNPSLSKVRGGPTVHLNRKVLPTFHPSFVRYKPIWRDIFRSDIAKAFRHFEEKLRWKDPRTVFTPTPAQLEAFLRHVEKTREPVAYDVETDALEPLTAGLRCIGIGTPDIVLMVPFLSVDGTATFYEPQEELTIKKLMREFFLSERICKVGHNAGYYDRLVVEQHLGVTPTPLIDTILLHRLAESEYPHGLGYIGSVFTDVPAWKADRTATTASADHELHVYCATDVAVTARITQPLLAKAKIRRQRKIYKVDAALQDLCVGMHRLGMRVDEGKRKEYAQKLTAEVYEWESLIDDRLGSRTINPNSPVQMRELLFDRWALPPHSFTPTGDPSANDATLRSFLGNPLVEDDQKEIIDALRRYRKASKLLNTYIEKLAPGAGVVEDGIAYPDYNVHGTVSGRFSSSSPNFQNIPFKLRDMFIPPKGMVFVGADFDQLELRFAAALAGAKHYMDAFEKKEIDPHNLTGELMFGEDFWLSPGAPAKKIEKGKGSFKKLRDVAKTICFSSLYGASPPKVHEIITKAEDDQGTLMYAGYSLQEVRALHRKWLRAAPEFKGWWNETHQFWRRNGYVEEPVMGRRRYFIEDDYNAIINFGVQAGGFSVVAIGMLELVNNYLPFDFKKNTGLVNQLHDAVLFTVEEGKADWAREVITKVLTRRVKALPITFTAEANIANNWAEV